MTNLSKTLAYLLRHHPEQFNITLLPGGWAPLAEVVTQLTAAGHAATVQEIHAIVAQDSKNRYSVQSGLIRANQGHSTTVDLQLTPEVPPAVLFHGTATRFVSSIASQGLNSQTRHAVHLSASAATAESVGARHGTPVVLSVAAGQMHAAGHVFTRSQNNVWLVAHVPPQFITFP